MASVGDPGAVYQALLVVRTELLKKLVASGVDPNALIVKAKDKGVIGSIQASAKVAQSTEEKAEQLVNQLLEAVGTDETKAEEFVQLLEENSLGEIATFLRGKLTERLTGGLDPSRESHHPPDAGYQPKSEAPEPVSTEDSGVAKDISQLYLDSGNTSPEFDRTQHRRKSSGIMFEAVPGGIVYAEQEHTGNLPVASENPVESVTDTQPHLEESQAMMGGSSVPVLPETKRLLQTNQDLQAQLAEKTRDKQKLQEELRRVSIEKEKSEKKVAQKEKELEVKELQIKKLKEEVERLQQELQNEKESNVREKQMLKEQIKDLESQLKEMEETFYKEKIDLMKEKHKLELQVERMHTKEETLKRTVEEEKCKVAEEKRKVAELNTDKMERTVSDLKREHERQMEEKEKQLIQHQNSMTEMEQKIRELEKQNSTMEPDTS